MRHHIYVCPNVTNTKKSQHYIKYWIYISRGVLSWQPHERINLWCSVGWAMIGHLHHGRRGLGGSGERNSVEMGHPLWAVVSFCLRGAPLISLSFSHFFFLPSGEGGGGVPSCTCSYAIVYHASYSTRFRRFQWEHHIWSCPLDSFCCFLRLRLPVTLHWN